MSSHLRAAAALLLALALAGCRVELYSGLNETEANVMLAALAGARIDAVKVQVDDASWGSKRALAAMDPGVLAAVVSECRHREVPWAEICSTLALSRATVNRQYAAGSIRVGDDDQEGPHSPSGRG